MLIGACNLVLYANSRVQVPMEQEPIAPAVKRPRTKDEKAEGKVRQLRQHFGPFHSHLSALHYPTHVV